MKKYVSFMLVFVFMFTFQIVNAEPKLDVTMDFSGYSNGNIVKFTDRKGRITVFDSTNGIIQTERMRTGLYTIDWSINPSTQSSCSISFPLNEGVFYLLEQTGSMNVTGVNLVESYGGFSVSCR